MTRAYIDTCTELYPATVIKFSDEPGWGEYDDRVAVDVPADLAARWREARDRWDRTQEEIKSWLNGQYGKEQRS